MLLLHRFLPRSRFKPASWVLTSDSCYTSSWSLASATPARQRAYHTPPVFFLRSRPDPSILSEEQHHVLKLALRGESLFFTGAAGTGKSHLLRQIIASLKEERHKIAVTASTGLAALNIGGETLHKFAGVGLGNQHASLLISKAVNRKNIDKWKEVDVLIIDEISMVEARWFDVVSEIGKVLRGNRKPFGGIQVIISGDFFQLPPVPEQSYVDAGVPVKFAFQANDWDQAVPHKIELTKVFRQREPRLVQMLNDMRVGKISPSSTELLYSLERPVECPDGIKPVELYPLRLLADAANLKQMEKLVSNPIVYRAKDYFGWDIWSVPITPERGRLLLDRMVRDAVELKVGAQVMCIKNLTTEVVNGTLGKIIDFLTPGEALKSPYFIDTVPNADPDWDHCIYNGSPQWKPDLNVEKNLKDKDLVPGRAFPWPIIETEGRRWPLVLFENGTYMLITPAYFSHENVRGGTEACRVQVPLILAWALSVHKAQGQTLARVKVDLARTFAPGQAYVGISRCTSLEGLEVQNFSPSVVFAHEDVMVWNNTLTVASGETEQRRFYIDALAKVEDC